MLNTIDLIQEDFMKQKNTLLNRLLTFFKNLQGSKKSESAVKLERRSLERWENEGGPPKE